MQEYEKALQSVGSLREQLTTALVEQERLIQERDEARRVLAHAERQSQRWQMQCQDLSKQVRAAPRFFLAAPRKHFNVAFVLGLGVARKVTRYA